MCSIAGFYCYGEARPHVETLKGLMMASQTRGRSASGMAYQDKKGTIMIRKQEGPAENMVKGMSDNQWAEVARSPRALFHARATTKGSEKDNENNHPVSQYNWVAIHNGHISNDDDLFSYYKAERYAAVDTAAVPLVLSQGRDYDDSLRHLSLLGGQASVAVWSVAQPEKIALARMGTNDVYLFLDPSRDIMYWCSTPLAGRAIPGYSLGNMAFFTVGKLHENKVMVLEPGTEKARLLKLERRPFFPRKVYVPTPLHPLGSRTTPSGGETTGQVRGSNQGTLTPMTPQGGVVKSAKSFTRGGGRREFEWVQRNRAWEDKPSIDTSGISNEWFEWASNLEFFRDMYTKHGKIKATKTLYTGYGRWMFECPNVEHPEKSTATFLPARRIKKYWRRYYNSQIPDLKLPAVLGKLDGVMTLEEFMFKEVTKSEPEGRVSYLGYLCPWCGITMKTVQWANLLYRCPCCGIVSQPYRKGEYGVSV